MEPVSQQNPQSTERLDPQGQPVEPADQQFTPQITAKQAQRVHAPARAMLISMAVLVLLALPFFLLQPRPDGQTYRPDVNVAQEAAYASDVAAFTPLAPDLGDGYSPNFARWQGNTADGVDRWEAGWVTPSSRFVELIQTDQANPTWVADVVDQAPATGSREAHGIEWEMHQKENDRGQVTRSWVGKVEDSTVVLTGTGSDAEFDHVAQSVVEAQQTPATPAASPSA